MRVPGSPLRTLFQRIVALPGWIERSFAYLFEMFTGICCLCGEVLLLWSLFADHPGPVYWSHWVQTCLWALMPTLRLDFPPLSPFSFWMGFVLLAILVIVPLPAPYLLRDGMTQMMRWSHDPNGQSLRQLRRHQAQLAYLQVLAQHERDDYQFWQEHKRRGRDDPSAAGATPRSRRTIVGPWSFAYARLSRYLGIPAATLSYGDEVVSLPQRAVPHQQTGDERQERPPYRLSLFGKLRLVLVGTTTVEIPIKSFRVRELLAYLALPARERDIPWEQVVTYAYKAHTRETDPKKLLEMLHNDAKALRKAVQEKCAEAGVAYIDPVKVTGHGPGAYYRLAEAYEVVDIAQCERLSERIPHLQQEDNPSEDPQALRKDYQEVLQSVAEGFLGPQMRDKRVGTWATPYAQRYRTMYHRLLLDLAEYEYRLSTTQQEEVRRSSLQQAVKLYEQCALLTAPIKEEEIQHGDQTRLSEHALRQCLICYGKLGDVTSVRHTYHHYAKTMQRRSSGYQPEPQTREVYEELTGSGRPLA